MVIGVLMIVLCIIAVTIGTRQGDAIVLYYDAEFEPVVEEGQDEVPGGGQETLGELGDEDAIAAGVELSEEYVAETQPRQGVKVSVGGAQLNGGVRQKAKPEETVDELRSAAKRFDPTKKAQHLFDDITGGRL